MGEENMFYCIIIKEHFRNRITFATVLIGLMLIIAFILSGCSSDAIPSDPTLSDPVLPDFSSSSEEVVFMDELPENIEFIIPAERPYSLRDLLPPRSEWYTNFSYNSTLYTYFCIGDLTDGNMEFLEEELYYGYDYLNEVTLGDLITENLGISYADWIKENHPDFLTENELAAMKEQSSLQLLFLGAQLNFDAGDFHIEGLENPETSEMFATNPRLRSLQYPPELPHMLSASASSPSPSEDSLYAEEENSSNQAATSAQTENSPWTANVDYNGNNKTILVTSTLIEDSSFFDNAEELAVFIGSYHQEPSVVLNISSKIIPGQVYTSQDYCGFNIENPNAVFNAGFSYSSMFGYATYSHVTYKASGTREIEEAVLTLDEWDTTNGIISGYIHLTIADGDVYSAYFRDSYKDPAHPTRDDDYLAYLASDSDGSNGDIPIITAPDIGGTQFPCDNPNCLGGKVFCEVCIGVGKVERMMSGQIMLVPCPVTQCKNGWKQCDLCGGDSIIGN